MIGPTGVVSSGLDAWTKTMVAIKVLTTFKKKHKKRKQEQLAKEKRRTVWRRLALKLRIFNFFAHKINPHEKGNESFVRLKRKLGKSEVPRLMVQIFPRCGAHRRALRDILIIGLIGSPGPKEKRVFELTHVQLVN